MLKLKILTSAMMAIALSLATGCTNTPQQDQNTSQAPSGTTEPVQRTDTLKPTSSPTPLEQTNLSSADKLFINEAAQSGLAEVQLGQIASERGGSDAVKQFGQRMVQDHTQVNNELQRLATQKGITLPTNLSSEAQQQSRKLSQLSGASFDREYMNDMVSEHVKDVSLFQRQAQRGQDADLRAFAAQTLPILQQHLQDARAIANPTNSTSTPTPTSTSTP